MLDKHYLKDPSLLNHAQQLLKEYWLITFPNLIDKEHNLIIEDIICAVNYVNKINDQKPGKFMQKILLKQS
jgi:hypothetical protein